MLTKNEVINRAYSQLRISGLTVDPQPSEIELALDRFESMMAEYDGRNICLDYIFEETPALDSSTGVDIQFNQMMETNLAVRLIPDFGKQISQDNSLALLGKQATQSLSNASARSAIVNRTNYPDRQALGSGNTFRWSRWRRYYKNKADAPISCDTVTMPLNTVKTVIESWVNQLATDEKITAASINYTAGLTQTSLSFTDNSVTFTVLGNLCEAQYATISVVTNLTTPNNFDVRTVDFNIIDNNSRNS